MKQERKLSYDYRNLLAQGHREHPRILVTQLILQGLTHQVVCPAKGVALPVLNIAFVRHPGFQSIFPEYIRYCLPCHELAFSVGCCKVSKP